MLGEQHVHFGGEFITVAPQFLFLFLEEAIFSTCVFVPFGCSLAGAQIPLRLPSLARLHLRTYPIRAGYAVRIFMA